MGVFTGPGFSVSLLQWGRRTNATECRNGIAEPAVPGPAPQWARRTNATEWAPQLRALGVRVPASMGPPHECDGMATTATWARNIIRFNGAAARMRRNGQRRERFGLRDVASMGPPHECDGMIPRAAHWTGVRGALQWGRRTNATECNRARGHRRP